MERRYKYAAVAYMKLLHLQDQVKELESLLILSGQYVDSYELNIEIISNTIDKMIEQLEFKYK